VLGDRGGRKGAMLGEDAEIAAPIVWRRSASPLAFGLP